MRKCLKLFGHIVLSVSILLLSCQIPIAAEEDTQIHEINNDMEIIDLEPGISPDVLRTEGFCGRRVYSFAEDAANSGQCSTMAIPGVSSYYNMLSLLVEVQQNDHYCGPATVIQNLRWLSGYEFDMTQDQVAAAIGTTDRGSDSDSMVEFMNNQINSNGYSPYNYEKFDIYDESFDEDFYVDSLYSNCRYYNWPSFGAFHLRTTAGGPNATLPWPYSTEGGHFVSYCGVDIAPTYNDICVADPYFNVVFTDEPISAARYWVNAPVCLETILSFIW